MQHAVIFWLFSVLCDAKTLIQTEGGSITAKCSFAISGGGKFLCRHPCEDGDVLLKTEATEAQRGRYSIRYKEGTFPVSSTVLYVNISQLAKSDSGRYKCGLKRRFMIDAHQEFNIVVTDALNSPPDRPKQLDQQQTDETGASKGHILPLAFCVAVLIAAAVLFLYKWKTRRKSDGSTSRVQSSCRNNRSSRNVQFVTSKCSNWTPPPDGSCCGEIYCNL
ncbi:hypothetical protein AMECASPLE_033410 [Ameca splendens]|uniref:Immunoglobulin V-set domain-containing protein n=1 Tax=Ameca splendens TaxID=208324 RepID=A0ABV0XJR9_9TELE